MDPAIIAEIKKSDDSIPFRAVRNHTQSTWARTFHSSPELFIQPQSLAEVEKVVNLARKCRRRITTVGCGHSPSDMTCTSSWLVNLDNFNTILSVDRETGIVVMQSGIRLHMIGEELDKVGLAMPNLGSINDQSIAGAISTGTHGSTLRHGILSQSVLSLKITLANGKTELCSPTQNPDLFRAALISLGALGIITEITFQAVPAFTLKWQQTVDTDISMFNTWNTLLWTQTEFVRVWWFPYTRRAVTWTAEQTGGLARPPPKSYYDAWLGYHVYHNLLQLAQYFPRVLPWVEWFVFGMQYGFANGSTTSGIQPSRQALLMNCLYSQYVNEWAIPLRKGPEALRRLSSWLNHLAPSDPDYVPHNIPFSADNLYVHAPVEVRVSDTSKSTTPRPHLDPTCTDEATLYLNATLYRPYNSDPPCRDRYYEAFEYLMRDLGGKPHWAKNFETSGKEIEKMYGENLLQWRKLRNEADPEGIFVGEWHRRHIMGDGPKLALEETEVSRHKLWSGGLKITGKILEVKGSLAHTKSDPSSSQPHHELRDEIQESLDLYTVPSQFLRLSSTKVLNRNHGYGKVEEDAAGGGARCGKGTPRRKVKKVHKSAGADDKKLQTSLKKLNVQPIQAIEEVNMFKADGNVIHFAAPKVHAAVPANTFAIYGNGEDKELTELVPGILNQLGPDSLASLRKLAESYQSMQKSEGGDDKKDDDDDDIPDLVAGENFEEQVE